MKYSKQSLPWPHLDCHYNMTNCQGQAFCYLFKGGSESGSLATIWSVRGLHVIILSNFSFTWEPAQEAHRKEAQLLKYSGLTSGPSWVAFKCKCIVLVNLYTERRRKKHLPSLPAKELSHPWQTMRWHDSLNDGIPQWKVI